MKAFKIDEKKLKENQPKEFSLMEIIQFGYFARKHPDLLMRKTYLKWKEQSNKL